MQTFIKTLSDKPANSPDEVFRRCEALQALSRVGPAAQAALPAIIRTLVVPVTVDCHLALRVAAAEAVWKVGERRDLALPFLAWALNDEQWGLARQAARILGEMGSAAHAAIPNLVQLANRRVGRGPFQFELFESLDHSSSAPSSLLAVVATSLGRCGYGVEHWREARRALHLIQTSPEEDARSAAAQALDELKPLDDLLSQ